MKKIVLFSLLSLVSLGLVACGNSTAEPSSESSATPENKVVKIAAHLPTMVDIIKVATPVMEEAGYTLELVQVNDNIQYNELLKNEEVDANFAQHEPFMETFNQERDAKLVAVQKIYDAKVGFYSKNAKTIDEIPAGSKVAIPSDVSNEGRALAILDNAGLITLDKGVGFEGTTKDIVANPHNFQWLSVDLLNLSETYDEKDVSLVYNYPAYIAKIDLTPDDALILEEKIDQRFSISLVAREDNQDSPEITALKKAMTSPEVKTFLEEEHGNTIVPSF